MHPHIKNEIAAELHLFKRAESPIWKNARTETERKIINEDVEALCERICKIFEKYKNE